MKQDREVSKKCCGNNEEWRKQRGNARTRCGPHILQNREVNKKCCGNTEAWRKQRGNARTLCGPHILFYLRTKVRGLIIGIIILLHMHVFVCAIMCEFRGRNFVKGGRM